MTTKKHGRGRRLSAAQVSHALQTIPRARLEAAESMLFGTPPNRAARRARATLKPTRPPHSYLRPAHLGDYGIGYYADTLRDDDCFRAAIATATQIPIEQVPDLRLHDRLLLGDDPDEINVTTWQTIARWLDRRGLDLVYHKTMPADRERWVGVCVVPPQPENPFTDHCLVMSYGRVIFDPALGATAPRGTRVRPWRVSDVKYGLGFDPQGE